MENVKHVQLGKSERVSFSKIDEVIGMPNLIEVQKDSYKWFVEEGIMDVLHDVSPITDYSGNLVIEFVDYSLSEPPKYDQETCKERDATYAAPLKVKVRLITNETGEVKEQEVFMGDFPLMTEQGTFVINGAERVIVSQLVRSPGVYYSNTVDKSGKKLGDHCGIIRYTIGQRKGLGLALPAPMYVCEKDVINNKVILCSNQELFFKTLTASKFNWIAFDAPPKQFRADAKIRYNQAAQPATVIIDDEGTVTVTFDEPQRAIAKGQAVVLYDGDTVIGGGTIN